MFGIPLRTKYELNHPAAEYFVNYVKIKEKRAIYEEIFNRATSPKDREFIEERLKRLRESKEKKDVKLFNTLRSIGRAMSKSCEKDDRYLMKILFKYEKREKDEMKKILCLIALENGLNDKKSPLQIT